MTTTRTTRVSQYQKKYSFTHFCPDHQPSFISFPHLLRSIAYSLFSLCAWQVYSLFAHQHSPFTLPCKRCLKTIVVTFAYRITPGVNCWMHDLAWLFKDSGYGSCPNVYISVFCLFAETRFSDYNDNIVTEKHRSTSGSLLSSGALILLVGLQEGLLACKKLSGGMLTLLSVWDEMQICICPADATVTHYLLLQ